MSYRYYANKQKPLALWTMDDVPPYEDHSGFNRVSNTRSTYAAATKHAAIVAGTAYSSVFSNTKQGVFLSPVFQQGSETKPFALEAWIVPIKKTTTAEQQVLGNFNRMDGITVNGSIVSFVTKYLTSGECRVSYDLQSLRRAHVVGMHNAQANQLYIDGELVAETELTGEQKEDLYVVTNGSLYSGATTSLQEFALGGVGIYSTLSPEGIKINYAAGNLFVSKEEVVTGFGGQMMTFGDNVYFKQSWIDSDDFYDGLNEGVTYDTAVRPAFVNGVSQASSWTIVPALETRGLTSIYGVSVDWSGNNVTLEASLDGVTWTALTRGRLIPNIAQNSNPQNLNLRVRASFVGGKTDDSEWLESLEVRGYRNNSVSLFPRVVTAPHPSVLNDNLEPIEYSDKAGIYLAGQTLTFAADPNVDAQPIRTIEVWVKVLSGTLTTNYGGAESTGTYINGGTYTTPPVGEWVLFHTTINADRTVVTFTGDVIIGHVGFYSNELTATQIANAYASYTGRPTTRVTDSLALTVSESSAPVDVYGYDWSITGGGG